MSEEEDFLQSLRQTFLEESKELVEQAEHLFLEFERAPSDMSLIEKIFQLYHTLKGGAGGAEYRGLQSFTHSVENLLVPIRKGDMEVSERVIDVLMRSNDQLVKVIDELEAGAEDSKDHEPLVAEIDSIIAGKEARNSEIPEKPEKIEGFHLFEDDEMPAAASPQKDPPSLVKPSNDDSKKPTAPQKGAHATHHEEFVKLPMSKIQKIIDQFGEQVILQSILERHKDSLVEHADKVSETISSLAKITRELQQTSMSLRMFSIQPLFYRMQKIVRDTAKELGKKVRLETSGENVEIDKAVYDALASTVIHLVKNSVDHGIETAEERKALGKDETGTITIAAKQKSGSFILEISDDGRGLAKDKILSKAIAKGVVAEDAELTDREIYHLIFNDGLSTKEVTTSVSGRGVGMSAIKSAVTELKGTIEISSTEGSGSTVELHVPLSLSVFNGTVVRVGAEQYILPNTDFTELVNIPVAEISHDNIAMIKGKAHTVSFLDDHLDFARRQSRCGASVSSNSEGFELAVIVDSQGKGSAFIVDEMIAQERIVLKNLGDEVRNTKGVSGGTIRGDGNVTLILDVQQFSA